VFRSLLTDPQSTQAETKERPVAQEARENGRRAGIEKGVAASAIGDAQPTERA